MALLIIGGSTMPTPSEFSVQISDLSRAERTANGTLSIDRVATKRKLEIGYRYMSRTDLGALLAVVDPETFEVEYMDPKTNAMRTSTFYCGDRSVGMMDFVGGVPRYKDVRFSLVEV